MRCADCCSLWDAPELGDEMGDDRALVLVPGESVSAARPTPTVSYRISVSSGLPSFSAPFVRVALFLEPLPPKKPIMIAADVRSDGEIYALFYSCLLQRRRWRRVGEDRWPEQTIKPLAMTSRRCMRTATLLPRKQIQYSWDIPPSLKT